VNYREAYGLFCGHGILSTTIAERGETFVDAEDHSRGPADQAGLQDKLFLGNLDAKRDWGFAGDYIEAMWLMLQQDKPDNFVIATGERISVREFLDETFRYLELDWQNRRNDPRYFRPTEVDLLLGDAARPAGSWLEAESGFRPTGQNDDRHGPADCAE